MSNSTIDKVIEEFGHLPIEDKEYVVEVIRKQLIEVKRERLADRVREVRTKLDQGMVKEGTVKDLMEDLERD